MTGGESPPTFAEDGEAEDATAPEEDTYPTDNSPVTMDAAPSSTQDDQDESESSTTWYHAIGSIARSVFGKRPTFTVAGRKVRVANWLDPEDNATIGPVSFMSSVREKHALSFGFGVTFPIVVSVILGIDPLTLLATIFGGAVAGERAIRRALKTQHAKDAFAELAYTGLGSMLALGVITLLAGIAAALQRDPAVVLEQFLRFLRTAYDVSQVT